MQPCTFNRIQLASLLGVVTSVVIILMVLFFFNYPAIARQRIIESMVFSNDSDSMTRFSDTNNIKNLQIAFYLFNVTNVQDVISNSAKIHLQEVGPFVYKEFKYREFIDNNQTSGLITYRLKRRYVLDLSSSVSDPAKALITWPNVPLIVASSILNKLSSIEKGVAYSILNGMIARDSEQAFIVDSVQNFTFNGSYRKLFQDLQNLDIFKLIKPWPLKDNKFALMYQRNDTWNPQYDRLMTTATGFGTHGNYKTLNQYVYINGSNRLPYWRDKPPGCNQVGGTDGEFFHPFLTDVNQTLSVYSIDICRKIELKFKETTQLFGVNSWLYTLDKRTFYSGFKDPNHMCYCLRRDKSGNPSDECRLDGLIDLSNCAQPNVIASGAHFFAGSEELLQGVDGLTPPNETVHEPQLYVEPNTGLTVKVRVPIQLNVRLEKNNFRIFNFFKSYKPLILPILYAVETSSLTEDQGEQMRRQLLLLDSWLVTMVLGGAIVFIIVILVVAISLIVKYRTGALETNFQPDLAYQTDQDQSLEDDPSEPLIKESTNDNDARPPQYQSI